MALPPVFTGLRDVIEADLNQLMDDVETAGTTATTAITTAKDTALTAVENAAAVYTYPVGVFVFNPSGVSTGTYYADFSGPYSFNPARFVGKVIGGTGSLSITFLSDGAPLYGPVTLTTTETVTAAPAAPIVAGADIDVLVESVTGTVTGFYAKLEGLPA